MQAWGEKPRRVTQYQLLMGARIRDPAIPVEPRQSPILSREGGNADRGGVDRASLTVERDVIFGGAVRVCGWSLGPREVAIWLLT
jgi:hypothetical protein